MACGSCGGGGRIQTPRSSSSNVKIYNSATLAPRKSVNTGSMTGAQTLKPIKRTTI